MIISRLVQQSYAFPLCFMPTAGSLIAYRSKFLPLCQGIHWSDDIEFFIRFSLSGHWLLNWTVREYLDNVALFHGCSEKFLDAVSVLLREVQVRIRFWAGCFIPAIKHSGHRLTCILQFSPEEFLFRSGEIASDMFFVVSGSVDEVSESEVIRDLFGRRGFFAKFFACTGSWEGRKDITLRACCGRPLILFRNAPSWLRQKWILIANPALIMALHWCSCMQRT